MRGTCHSGNFNGDTQTRPWLSLFATVADVLYFDFKRC